MNEKHFGMRLPKADYEVLVALAERDRSTVAQQVRQAVARYIFIECSDISETLPSESEYFMGHKER